MRMAALCIGLVAFGCTGEGPAAPGDDGTGQSQGTGSSGAGNGGSSAAVSGPSSSPSASQEMSSSSSRRFVPGEARVWGHSSERLWKLDPESFTITPLGAFIFQDEDGHPAQDVMTDLAVTAQEELYGCSYGALYRIDPMTMIARRITTLSDVFNGLTFVPRGMIDPDEEVLVGVTNQGGNVYRLDVETGASHLIGSYGGGWVSSGDVVAVDGEGMFATVNYFEGEDHLARVDPGTGAATIMEEPVGVEGLWGLGYWGGVLFAFATNGKIVAIDVETGVGTVAGHVMAEFWGAGVTTKAKLGAR